MELFEWRLGCGLLEHHKIKLLEEKGVLRKDRRTWKIDYQKVGMDTIGVFNYTIVPLSHLSLQGIYPPNP